LANREHCAAAGPALGSRAMAYKIQYYRHAQFYVEVF